VRGVPERPQVCQALVSPLHDIVTDQAITDGRRVGRIGPFHLGTGVAYKMVSAIGTCTDIALHIVQ